MSYPFPLLEAVNRFVGIIDGIMTVFSISHSSLMLAGNMLEEQALKEIISQTDQYLDRLSSKTHVFEDKMTKYQSVWLFFLWVNYFLQKWLQLIVRHR